jgi:hypothetical protein
VPRPTAPAPSLYRANCALVATATLPIASVSHCTLHHCITMIHYCAYTLTLHCYTTGCFNRHYAEHSGYFTAKTSFLQDVDRTEGSETTYYDSVSGKPLFVAPRGRSFADFLQESNAHGWPSFRDEEVVWENVRCLADGETVSLDGTHVSEVK